MIISWTVVEAFLATRPRGSRCMIGEAPSLLVDASAIS